ncbi:hypothetical protein A0H81_07527 [Grifola frondosa]|uniref:F-box domain-containing protein n=1 Tax=Grifola frondosa TaxID=5627 RepID=A0A1C7M5S9_GRIFR|nr:hypothetical protein A0H81_07527 [Grifola frondosa]
MLGFPQGRYTISERVVIPDRPTFDLFVKHVSQKPGMERYLESVHELVVRDSTDKPYGYLVQYVFVGHMTHLKCLGFNGLRWRESPPTPTFHPFLSEFKNLTVLALWDCTFTNLGELQRLILSSRSLVELNIGRLTLHTPARGARYASLPKASPTLKIVRLTEICNDVFINLSQWMAQVISQSVETYEFHPPPDPTADWRPSAENVLKALGGSLKNLIIPAVDQPVNGFSLAHNVNLESLTISVDYLGKQSPWITIANTLLSITGPPLINSLRLQLWCIDGNINGLPWDRLDYTGMTALQEILEREDFKGLTEVMALIAVPEHLQIRLETVLEEIEHHIPRLTRRGILKLEVVPILSATQGDEQLRISTLPWPWCPPS